MKKILIFAGIALVVFIVSTYTVLSAGVVKAPPEPTPTAEPAPVTTPFPPGGPAPDKALKGKTVAVEGKGWFVPPKAGDVVRVTGTVTDVTVDPGRVWVDLLVQGRDPSRVECMTELNAPDHNVMRYVKGGEKITVEGRFDYKDQALTRLNNCVLVK